jgi:hypothetical protein
LSWAFLLEVLSHLGFGIKWRNLFSNILFTSSTQVMLNGVPGNIIMHRKGLRQGDPLSPMLFVLVMDVLRSLFKLAENRGLLHDLDDANVRCRLSIYADDVVLFVRPLEEDLKCVRLILDCFGAASGLESNMHKSCVIPIGCDGSAMQEGCRTLRCAPAAFPCTYLGLPVSDKKPRRSDLMIWADKIADRLPNWKAHIFNLAGRTALVRFVLSAIPVDLLIAIIFPIGWLNLSTKLEEGLFGRGGKRLMEVAVWFPRILLQGLLILEVWESLICSS